MLTARFNELRATSLRARPGEVLDDAAIRRVAPSVFATEAHDSRSTRYAYIPTSEVIVGMRANGFEVVAVAQSRTRDASRRDYTKHLLRFRFRGALQRPLDNRVGAVFPEIVLVNSHDGTSSYHLMEGLLKLLCLNGLVVAVPGGEDEVKVPHKGNVTHEVIEGSYRVIEHAQDTLGAVNEWSGLIMSREEQNAMAEAAHVLRWEPDENGNAITPIRPAQLLAPRRFEDNVPDLWHVFNRIQENSIKGGLTAMGNGSNGRPRRTTSREVAGIDQNVKLNRALWVLAQRMAELKAA